jgi:hypothetical protein
MINTPARSRECKRSPVIRVRFYTPHVRAVPSVNDAAELACKLLEPLANRRAHLQAVAARADDLAFAVGAEPDRQLLVVAAWLHDLGYAPELRDTGCHQIDGARFLTAEGYPERSAPSWRTTRRPPAKQRNVACGSS